VFTARYALSPYIKQMRFVFKGLNNIKLLVFVMETQCVYYEEGLNFYLLLRLSSGFMGRAMAQAASRWPFTAGARVRSQASRCENCDGQSDTGAGLSPSTSFYLYMIFSVSNSVFASQ
jgi:hypothetical protein